MTATRVMTSHGLELTEPVQGGGGVRPLHDMPELIPVSMLRVRSDGRCEGVLRADLDMHVERWGPRGEWFGSRGALLREWVADIELTGRGGSHFPAARKWDPVIAAGAGGTVVVNAAEGEPASAKDAALLQAQPHLVLDGAVDVAEVVAAREIVVWLHHDARASRSSLDLALLERREHGLAEPTIRILEAPQGYAGGEASAVIQGVSGAPALPRAVLDPARPWGEGMPVLVHNAETLARVAALARLGTVGYRPSSIVTLATLTGRGTVGERVVVEVTARESAADALHRAGFAVPEAVLLGGYGGSWIAWGDLEDQPLDPAQLAPRGLSLGAGVIVLARTRADVEAITIAITEYLAGESARQCGPCTFGLPAIARAVKVGDVARLQGLLPLVEGRGACRLPDGAVRMVRSSMELLGSRAPGEERHA